MRKLYYMGLEPYDSRYTLQLTEWNRRVFKRRNIDYVIVEGETLTPDKNIVTGQVLDAHGRTYYSLTQMANLVKLMKAGETTDEDVIYFEDMYTSGIDSIPYILKQVDRKYRPRVYVRCLAQTIDPDDFLHVHNMQGFMRKYEEMVNEFVYGILASNEEMIMHMKVAGYKAALYNISGLAYGKSEVLERVNNVVNPFNMRSGKIAFSSRWDQEKQPHFYMDLIEKFKFDKINGTPVEFCIYSGGKLRSNDTSAMHRAYELQNQGKLTIYDNLSKNEYYNLLNDTRVLFNCALQDWTSNTVSEADTLGCNVLFPAYRSFPEIFANDHERLYVPWSLEDAMNKLTTLFQKPHANMGKISDYTDGTIDRILDVMDDVDENVGTQRYIRYDTNYRKYVREKKY